MITKGIVESIINEHEVRVRLPLLDGIKDGKHSTKEEHLAIATICSFPNTKNVVVKGDVVFVGFEDNDYGKPIILGQLSRKDMNKSQLSCSMNKLDVLQETKLPYSTQIGNIYANEIQTLSGINGNIQNQINLNNEKIEHLNLTLDTRISRESLSVVPQLKNIWLKYEWYGDFQEIWGDNIWIVGNYVFYSNGATQKYMQLFDNEWKDNTFEGFNGVEGKEIWRDYNGNIYFSQGYLQKKFDPKNWTWTDVTWNGFTPTQGMSVWNDGNNIFYSGTGQYRLNNENSTWEQITWYLKDENGNLSQLIHFDGSDIWTDGKEIYCSNADGQYRLIDSNSYIWEIMIWNDFTPMGLYIWTDGRDIYCSNGINQFRLKSDDSHTWEPIIWKGLENIFGNFIWSDGIHIYYGHQSEQYELNGRVNKLQSF